MKRTMQLAALAALLGPFRPGGAQAATNGSFYSTAPAPSITPLLGYYVWGNDTAPRGFSVGNQDNSGNPIPLWDIAVDPATSDLFIYDRSTPSSQMVRVRAATGQITVGQTSGQPANSSQLDLWGGTSTGPRDGLGIETWGFQNSINLLQQSGNTVSRRTAINFNNLWNVGSDTGSLNNPNSLWYLTDSATNLIPIIVNDANNSDRVYVNTSLQVSGVFRHVGDKVGFYGAVAVTKPTITGSRTDGTALLNLLQNLQTMGLLTDSSTP